MIFKSESLNSQGSINHFVGGRVGKLMFEFCGRLYYIPFSVLVCVVSLVPKDIHGSIMGSCFMYQHCKDAFYTLIQLIQGGPKVGGQ